MKNKELDEKLEFMRDVAKQAGSIIQKGFYCPDKEVRLKEDGSVVTDTDLRVMDLVRERFAKRFPECGLLTEESQDSPERLSKENVFIVDELDGTADFSRGERDISFLCAYVEQGTPLIGVVNEPLKGRVFYAKKGDDRAYADLGGGEGRWFRRGTEIEVTLGEGIEWFRKPPVRWENLRLGHPKNCKSNKYQRLYPMLGISEKQTISAGGIGTRMMQVVKYESDVILGYTKKLKEWDVAAGHVILEAAGISITDVFGNPLKYNQPIPNMKNGVLVIDPSIKQQMLEKLAQCYDKLPI